MQSNGKPIIALTMGDPCGIGPEIIAKTLASGEVHSICRPVVIGNAWSMEQAVNLVGGSLSVREVESPVEAGLSPETLDVLDLHNLTPSEITVGRISPACGRAGYGVGYSRRRVGPGGTGGGARHCACQQRGGQSGRL